MKNNNIKLILLLLLFVGLVAYLGYTIFGMKSNHPEEECSEIAVIMDEQENGFITDKMVLQMLADAKVKTVGKKIKHIDMNAVKNTLEKNPFIKKASCYTTNNGMEVGTAKLCIKIVASFPVLLVFEDDAQPYYLDNHGKVVTTDSIYAKSMLVANGDIDKDYAKQLAPMALYISKDDFWNNQLEQIFVTKNQKEGRKLTLIPRVGNHKILFGTIDNYENKLIRLRRFYEEAMSKVGWNKYTELNVEYANQVVGVLDGHETFVMETDSLNTTKDTQEKTDSIKTDEKKNADVKKEEPKKDVKKEEPKKDVKKEEPKKDVKKEEPKKEESKLVQRPTKQR